MNQPNLCSPLIYIKNHIRGYSSADYRQDVLAGFIVAAVLLPQAMAYALMANVAPIYGVIASLLPLVIYALVGSGRAISVAPVAIIAAMTGDVVFLFPDYPPIVVAYHLSALIGIFLCLLGVFRLSGVSQLLSDSVVKGFTSASVVLIIVGQLRYLAQLDIERGEHLGQTLLNLFSALPQLNGLSLVLGCLVLASLLLVQWRVKALWAKALPLVWLLGLMLVIANSQVLQNELWLVSAFDIKSLDYSHIALSLDLAKQLAVHAVVIGLVIYLESMAVGNELAAEKRERLEPQRELWGLGLANLVAGASLTLPVAAGIGRSALNARSGAQSGLASLVTAAVLLMVLLFMGELMQWLPYTLLAAISIYAVLPLFKVGDIWRIWRFNRADGITAVFTFVTVLTVGIAQGLVIGIGVSLLLFLYRSGHPHIAIVGRLGDSEHFRNIERHPVTTYSDVLLIRVDESLYFANCRLVENFVLDAVSRYPESKHVVLIFSAVNYVDASAVETLSLLHNNLEKGGRQLSLAEVKGPVMDKLRHTRFLTTLGESHVFVSVDKAICKLTQVIS
jgi:SulP family sulfate permease